MLEAMGLMPLRLRTGSAPGVDAAAAGRATTPGGSGHVPDRGHPLFAALCAAAGMSPERSGEQDLAGWADQVELPGLSTLAADPNAKRDLWHRMRSLRRSARG